MTIYASGDLITNRYEVIQGPREKPSLEGGMGVVYICLDHQTGLPVALKTFKPEYLPDRAARDRFLREGTTWMNLGPHPHVVRCYEVIRDANGLEVYLALELIAKEQGREDASLRSWLFYGRPLPPETALLFALQIARGMQQAVARIPDFVHRDLKPENVLVGADHLPGTFVNRLRVTDFGLASVLQDAGNKVQDPKARIQEPTAMRHTQLTHGIVGTPLYMAPEQWTGQPVGVYTDVYALGCILYEMLTGYTAADGDSPDDLARAHCTRDLRPLPETIPAPVRYLLARCLAFAPASRYLEWDNVEFVLRNVYATVTGESVPPPADAVMSSREERVQVGWSYNAIGLAYLDISKAAVALHHFEQVLAIGQAEKTIELVGAAIGNLGAVYTTLGDAHHAIDCHQKVLAIAREIGLRSWESTALDGLGNIHADLGNTWRATEYYEQALQITRELGNREDEGNKLNSLGTIYGKLGDTQRAINYFEQALAIAQETGDRRSEGMTLGNLGVIYSDLGNIHRAINYYEQQLVIARQIGDRIGESSDLLNLGTAYAELQDIHRAIGYYKQALEIDRETGHRQGESNALTNLGSAYLKLDNIHDAIHYCEQALAIQQEIGDRYGEASSCWNLGLLYQKQGNLAHATELMQMCVNFEREVGHPDADKDAKYLAQLRSTDVNQLAFEAFQRADSVLSMQRAVEQFPFMIEAEFLAGIEQFIESQLPPEHRPPFEERLVALQQIAAEYK